MGGSILSHDHFQGGHYEFAMERAPLEETFQVEGLPEVEAGMVHWPLSVIRLRSENREQLVALAETDGEPHNTITPIARMRQGRWELDLAVLPARLKDELDALGGALVENRDIRADETLAKHADWAEELRQKYSSFDRATL